MAVVQPSARVMEKESVEVVKDVVLDRPLLDSWYTVYKVIG